jgi:hypothetical protein
MCEGARAIEMLAKPLPRLVHLMFLAGRDHDEAEAERMQRSYAFRSSLYRRRAIRSSCFV